MTPFILIFAHLSFERDGAALLECLVKSLQECGIRPRYVIFTTYQERQNGSTVDGNAHAQVISVCGHDLILVSESSEVSRSSVRGSSKDIHQHLEKCRS